jgi:hypothetical protein
MKNKKIIVIAGLLIVSIGNYLRIISDESIRAVEFLSIFAIGALAGVLLMEIFKRSPEKK